MLRFVALVIFSPVAGGTRRRRLARALIFGVARWAYGTGRLFVRMVGAGFDAAVVYALDPS